MAVEEESEQRTLYGSYNYLRAQPPCYYLSCLWSDELLSCKLTGLDSGAQNRGGRPFVTFLQAAGSILSKNTS
jgi:hypothetical protein